MTHFTLFLKQYITWKQVSYLFLVASTRIIEIPSVKELVSWYHGIMVIANIERNSKAKTHDIVLASDTTLKMLLLLSMMMT